MTDYVALPHAPLPSSLHQFSVFIWFQSAAVKVSPCTVMSMPLIAHRFLIHIQKSAVKTCIYQEYENLGYRETGYLVDMHLHADCVLSI